MRPFNGSDAEVVQAVTASRGCDPRAKVPSLPGNIAELVKKATAYDPRERFSSARQFGAAIARALLQIGASSKERDVTAALSALLDGEGKTQEPEGVPEPLDATNRSESDGVMALSEREMLEASGPIRVASTDVPTYVPDGERSASACRCRPRRFRRPGRAAKPPSRPATATKLIDAVRNAAAVEPQRNPLDRAVELFDIGIALRAQQRYAEALEAWEQALNHAPENLVYQASVQRLRAQLGSRRD